MTARIFLAIFGLLSLSYGISCFLQPGFLADFAGVGALSTTILLATTFQCLGLGSFRLMGALGASEFSAYTSQDIAFELGSALIAFFLWRAATRDAPASAAAR